MSDHLDAKQVKQRLDEAEKKQDVKKQEGEQALREKAQNTKDDNDPNPETKLLR